MVAGLLCKVINGADSKFCFRVRQLLIYILFLFSIGLELMLTPIMQGIVEA